MEQHTQGTVRVIKFRAVYEGKIYEVTELMWSDLTVTLWDGKHAEVQVVGIADVPLLQFTGLTDKNGVEIYEGDVVRFRSHPSPMRVAKVLFDQKSARFMADHTDGSGWDSFQHHNHLEVIGNIYENTELLK